MEGHGSTTGKYDGLDSDELRALVWAHRDEDAYRLAYDPRYCRMFGTSPGLMLGQLVHWSGKGHDPDGWLFFTKDGMMERFGLGSRYEVDEARHRLKDADVLEWTKKSRRDENGVCRWGPSPVLHYRVNLAALAELLDRFEGDPEGTIASIKRCFKPSTVGGSYSQDDNLNRRRSAVQSVEGERFKPPRVSGSNRSRSAALNTESTSETTDKEDVTEIPPLQAGAASPSANPPPVPITHEYYSTSTDSSATVANGGTGQRNPINDEEHDPGLRNPVWTIEAGGGESDEPETVSDLGTRRRYVRRDGELVQVGGRAREEGERRYVG